MTGAALIPEPLTPRKIAELCSEYLAAADMAVVMRALNVNPKRVLEFMRTRRERGFFEAPDVAQWVLEAARHALDPSAGAA
jgi:hypothetical protein